MGHPADRRWRHDRGALKSGDGDLIDLVTPTLLASLTGFFAGGLLTIWGSLVLRRGRLHTRQGAAVLVGAVVVIGLMLICASIVLLVSSL